MSQSVNDTDPTPTKRLLFVTEDVKKFPPPYLNPWLRLAVYLLITFLSGCVYWGWNGIQVLLYKAGSFEDLCDSEPNPSFITIGGYNYIDCGPRKSAINNLFTIAYSAQLMSSVFNGMILDYVGPKVCFMVGQFTNFICWVLISSIPRNPFVLRICFLLIGSTTESLYMPLTTVSHYFPENQSLVLSLMGAARSTSIVITVFLAKFYSLKYFKPGDLYKVGVGYSVLCNLTCFFLGALIIQRKFYTVEFEKYPEKMELETARFDHVEAKDFKESSFLDTLSKFRTLHRHPMFVEYVMLLVITTLFLTSIEFISKSHRDLLSTTYGRSAADVFKYIYVVSFIPAPALGYLMDKLGAPIVFVITHMFCLGYFLLCLTDYYYLKVVACLFFMFACSLCVSDTYCYIRQRFSPLHFGVLNGLCFFSAGLFSLTNIPLYDLGAKKLSHLAPNNFRPLIIIQIVYVLICLVLSVSLVFMTKKTTYRNYQGS